MPAAATRSRIRHVLKGLAVGAVVGAALVALRGTYVMQSLELKTLDARFRALHDPARADTNILIIDVDNLSLELLRHTYGRFPWPRQAWAKMVQYVSLGGARAIGFDFAFPEPDLDHPASDSAFAAAARAAVTVVQTMSLQHDLDTGATARRAAREDSAALARLGGFAWPGAPVPPGAAFQGAEHPYPLLLDAAHAVGVINFTPDPVDGTLRRLPLFFEFRGRAYPTLGLAMAATADPGRFRGAARLEGRTLALGAARVPLDDGLLLVNWRGPYRIPARRLESYRIYPAAQVLNSYDQMSAGDKPEVPPEAFRGKIVFVGASGSGLFEARANPFGPSDPGVLIHATVADNLLSGDFLRPAAPTTNIAVTLLAALLAGLAVSLIASAYGSAGAAAVLLVLQAGLVAVLFSRAHLWLDAAAPGIAVLLTFTGGMGLNYITEGRRKRQIREMFSKYVAPEYVAQLAEDPASLNLGGRRAELSILFSDIRGFTTISEKLEPHEVIEFLNEYLSLMAAIVKHSGGTLDKFIGDAVMAFWGEPVRHPDHADRAADCALEMRDTTARLAERWVKEGKPNLRIGIGINTAEVVVGNIGSLEHKLDYTVIGDGVNLASRLEGLNKDFGTTIIISEFARERLGDRFDTRPLGDVKVKGKEQPLPIYELLSRRRAEGAPAP
jgi:adenylate cyclase